MDEADTWHGGRPQPRRVCVRWGPSSPSPKGAQPQFFGPYLLRPNGCMDEGVTWYGARPRPRRLCVRWGPKGGGAPSQKKFGPCLLRPNGWMDETGTWHGSRSQPRRLCVRPYMGTQSPSPKKGRSPLPNFRPISVVAKELGASRCHLVWMLASAQGTLC